MSDKESKVKITLELELSDIEVRQILDNSIERVLNNATKVGHRVENHSNVGLAMDASTLWQDAEELKPIARKLWDMARNEIFREKVKESKR